MAILVEKARRMGTTSAALKDFDSTSMSVASVYSELSSLDTTAYHTAPMTASTATTFSAYTADWAEPGDERRGSFFDGAINTADHFLTSAEVRKQEERDNAEKWRVTSLNFLLGIITLHSLRGVREFKFMPYDVNDRYRSFVRVKGDTNIERLAQALIELGIVDHRNVDVRYEKAVALSVNWCESEHYNLSQILTGAKSDLVEKTIEKAVDDGLDLDDVVDELLDSHPLAGSW